MKMSSMLSHTHYSKTPYFSLHVKPRALTQKTLYLVLKSFAKNTKNHCLTLKIRRGVRLT